MRTWALLAILALAGCDDTGKDTDPNGGDADTDADSDADSDSDTDTDSAILDQVLAEGTVQDCSHALYFDEAVWAALYYVGDWTKVSDSRYEGYEYLVLYANDYWKDGCNGGCAGSPPPGKDCIITYQSVGTVIEPSASCPLCEFGMQVTAAIDESKSDCLRQMWDVSMGGDPAFAGYTQDYDVDVEGTTAKFRFGGSTTQFGEGTTDGTSLVYSTEADCKAF